MSAQKPVRWGVIGVGRFGKIHLKAIDATVLGEISAISNRSLPLLEETGQQWPQATQYADYRDLLADNSVDAVSIVTHWREHYQLAHDALAAGKHVLLEKPMATSSDECRKLLAIADQSPGKFMVGHICRFDPKAALAKEAIEAGRLGRVFAIHAKRNLPKARGSLRLDKISPLMGDGIHDCDLAMWLLNDSPKSVYARNVRAFDYVYPDVGWAMLNFSSESGNAIAVIETNWGLPENVPTVIDAKMEVVGTEGKLTIDCSQTGLSILTSSGLKSQDTFYWPDVHGRSFGVLTSEIDYFHRCILDDRDPQVVTPQEAAKAVAVMEAAEQSADSGMPIEIRD